MPKNISNHNPAKRFAAWIILIALSLLLTPPAFSQDRELRKMQNLADTLFQNMSIDELKMIQQEYQRRIEQITREEQKMRDMGLEVTQSLLENENTRIKDQDKILIRMAEYYIEEADKAYFAKQEVYDKEYEKYLEQLDAFYDGSRAEEPVPPEKVRYDYTEVIGIYDKILNEYPESEYASDALYNKAYLYQQMGNETEARRIYQEVTDRYPDSHLAAESYMRLAEYYFDPREGKDSDMSIVELQKAIKLYQKVLQYRDSKRYDEALYKLGWSYYRLTATDPKYYTDAIVYFLAVVDDIEKAEKMDPQFAISNPNVKDEAIQYIGISFADEETYAHAGVENARKFIEKIGGREYGVEIMRALGETYQKVEKNERAIDAYSNLIDMYPLYEEAPLIKRKIAETYYALGQDGLEYNTRYEMFRDYNPKSEWYAHIEKSELPDKLKYLQEAYHLTEEALRTNLALDLQKAQSLDEQKQPSIEIYKQVGEGCKEYLDVFPTDSNAYQINWYYALILDEHLKQYDEAFEQYVHVSNDYLETEHQEAAANNAIFVADTLRKLALGVSSDSAALFDLTDRENLRPDILSKEEKRLVEAYDNYIRLFPDGENTPIYLAAAGAIYFNHKQFSEAKVYFKTLVSRFPGAKERNIAMRSIMESYFALGQFRDSEFIAKRILNTPDIPDEQRIFAEKRLASAIFNNAKLYEDQGQYLEAAAEYLRVYNETPTDTTYVEAALFNSGQNFDKVKEWEQALNTYLLLADKYPQSKYAMSALGNAAEDYKELKQFSNAAQVYEKIYALNTDNPEQAEVALYNASYYYKQGEDWNNAIRVNNQYISTFPDNELATDFYFENAGHYLKLNNLTEANRIYEEFARRFPDDSRSVEAFYRRGDYYQEQGDLALAKAEYNKAIQKSEELNNRGLDPNRYYVGESLSRLVSMLQDEFAAIELRQPESNIKAQQARLRGILTQIVDNNRKIISNGSIRSFEAVYRNAEIYELFANRYANQERNPNMDAATKFATDKRINEESAALFEKAVEEYKLAIKNIPIIAEKFGVDIFAEPDTAEAVIAAADTSMSGVARVAEVDSTRDIALKWYNMSASKISNLHYEQAALTKANIENALATENPFKSDPLRGLIYQVQLIGTVVAPAAQQTIEAHQKNIAEAENLGLTNKYVEESKRQVLLTSNIPAEEIEKLAYQAAGYFQKRNPEYQRLVDLEYGTVNDQGLDYPLLGDNIKQMNDYSRDLTKATIDNYVRTLNLAQESGIRNDLIRTTENRMMRVAVEITDLYESYYDSVAAYDTVYAAKFSETENYNYDDASLFYQDLKFSYDDYTREILEYAFQISEQYEVKNLWATIVLGKLIKRDPARYAGNVERDRVEVFSDDSWLTSRTYTPGYNKLSFDDSGWLPARIVPSTYNQFINLGVDPKAMWYGIAAAAPVDTGMADSLGTGFSVVDTSMAIGTAGDTSAVMDSLVLSDSGMTEPSAVADSAFAAAPDAESNIALAMDDTVTVYFRKKVLLEGTPVDAAIYITADNDYRFFANQEYIIDDADDNFAVIDTLDFAYLSYYLKKGENIFSIHAVDTDNSGGGVKFYGYFEMIPADLTASMEAKSRVKKLEVDPILLKKIYALNKNRIPVGTSEE